MCTRHRQQNHIHRLCRMCYDVWWCVRFLILFILNRWHNKCTPFEYINLWQISVRQCDSNANSCISDWIWFSKKKKKKQFSFCWLFRWPLIQSRFVCVCVCARIHAYWLWFCNYLSILSETLLHLMCSIGLQFSRIQ